MNQMNTVLEYRPDSFKLTYLVYVDNDGFKAYENRVKVGDASYHTSKTIDEIIKEADPELLAEGFISTPEITDAANKRVKEWTGTADVPFKILLSALNIRETINDNGLKEYTGFRDYEVHNVLKRSGFNKRFITEGKKSGEWFDVDHANAKAAFKAALDGHKAFRNVEEDVVEIKLRDEQLNAVKRTKKHFKNGSVDSPKTFLWNAIMRFGKTLTTYQLVKDMYEADQKLVSSGKKQKENAFKKVLVITHRPVVSAGWSVDFNKIFGYDSETEWQFGAKRKDLGTEWHELDKNKPFVYFASIQDLRGSFEIDENKTEEEQIAEIDRIGSDDSEIQDIFVKNSEIFGTEYDLIVIDEGHEGTGTELAQKMMSKIRSPYKLHLSGTPYNIIEEFDEDHIFNWTYVDERKAYENWQKIHSENVKLMEEWDGIGKKPFDSDLVHNVNPYGNLPTLEIRTYNIEDTINDPRVKTIIDKSDKVSFNFKKFFEVDENPANIQKGSAQPKDYAPFKHKDMVQKLMMKIFMNDEYKPENERGLFPFGDSHSKKLFAHTFWLMPTIDSAIAMHEMLDEIDDSFYVINATGDNDSGDALKDVQEAVKKHKRTITLSVGKLTTGTTIPEWTGVFLFSNMKSPMIYMQTIFRVKSSGNLVDGRPKEVGYVFDFAPNRTLEMISRAAAATPRKKDKRGDETITVDEDGNIVEPDDDNYDAVDELLSYLPIIAFDGARFEKRDTNTLMQTLKRVYIREAVDKGFETPKMFSFDAHNVSTEDAAVFNELTQIVKKSGYDKVKSVKIAESELSEKLVEPSNAAPRDKKEVSEEEKARKADLKNAKNMKDTLMGVTVRIPLLVFAHDFEDKVITLDNFADKDIIDDESWNEFMPKGFTRDMWKGVTKFFDRTVFEGACKEINDRVRVMDSMAPLERVVAVSNLFSTFKNPDKETVLTPWRVVSMQVSQTLGGLRFVDDKGDWFCNDGQSYAWDEIEDSDGGLTITPVWVDQNIDNLWNDSSTFYDINSKTALYPLYATASVFYKKLNEQESLLNRKLNKVEQDILWQEIVVEQIFVNVRVPYSKKIAQRVLLGYNSKDEFNCSVVDIIKFRSVLKDSKFVDSSSNRERSLKPEEIYQLIGWVLLGVKDKGIDSMSVDDRFDLLQDDISKALAKAEKQDEDKFTAVLSNPPYQVEIGGKSHQVYAEFYVVGRKISEKISMIFPLGWQTSAGKASGSILHPQIRDDQKLVLVNNYYEDKNSPIVVFPEAATGGVSVVYADELSKPSNTVLFYEYNKLINKLKNMSVIKHWSDETQEIFDKMQEWMNNNNIEGMDRKITGRNPFGLMAFVTTDNSRHQYSQMKNYPIEGNLKYWARNKDNQNYNWWYCSDSIPDRKNDKMAKMWKVVFPKSGASSVYRKSMVFRPDELFTDTFISAFFNTEKQSNNFVSYIRSILYRFLISEATDNQHANRGVHRFVPDLSTIQNPRTGKVGWDSDWTDEDLKILFKDVLTDEDWEYIEKTALESDGGRR